MPRPPRRRLLRSALVLCLILAVAAAVAQLAGISGNNGGAPSTLVFDGTHETWLVQAPGRSAQRLDTATARLGGGKMGRELPGDWYEVQLTDEIAAADAEAVFGRAGATAVEPVLPRAMYEEPVGIEDPSPSIAPRATDQPDAIDDSPGALGQGSSLRSGPLTAARIGEQWALSQTSDQDVDAPEAWQTSMGTGTVVAVIDTGVDATHPDLVGRVLAGRDFSGSGTGANIDLVGHGTNIASVIAANGTSIAGVAPDARILPLKVFKDSAGGFSMSGYLAAIRYAADQGVDVINISLGCGGTMSCFSQAEHDALSYATERGVLVVTAAGNGDRTGNGVNNDTPETPDYPSGYELPGLVSVTSSTRFGDWSTWSNFGAQSVDMAAPGEGILVAAVGGSHKVVTGTSFSAPHVAAAAALLAAANPTATPDDLRARLMTSVVASPSLRTRTSSGGVLNANAALFAIGAASGGGGLVASAPKLGAPAAGAVLGAPPVLSWTLPGGWSSARVLVTGAGGTFNVPAGATSRALSHPQGAWRSGTYVWQVVGRDTGGRLVASTKRTYRILPRLGAWVTSGRVRDDGRTVRLRIGYAATEPSANVRVIVSAGGRVLHTGKAMRRTAHAQGAGSPRRGWFAYQAPLGRQLNAGERITVEVRVSAGGTGLTRRFRATVS